MKLIAGLGNPGRRYVQTRHNVGYAVVDELARRWGVDVTRHEPRFDGLLGEGYAGGQRVVLLKPATFMNLSGASVAAVWRFYKLTLPEVLVIHDDLDLPVGRLRLRAEGSSGGHKGLADVIRHVGSEDLARLRIGIGKVHRSATVEYVLSRFEPEECAAAAEVIQLAADAAVCWVAHGIEAAMNEFNRKGREQPEAGDATRDAGDEGETS